MIKHCAILSILLLSGQALAVGIGVRAGTTGLGADVGWSVLPTLSARLGYSALRLDRSIDDTDVRYEGRLRLSNFSALLDWSPLGPLRITGGLIGNDNRIGLTAQPRDGSYTFNGNRYSAASLGEVSGEISGSRRVAPYVGVGYGNVAGFGVNFYGDLGVMLGGSAKARVSARCGSAIAGTARCEQLGRDIAAEEASLRDKVDGFKYLPVLNIGLTVGF